MKKAMSICLSSCLLVGGLGAATAQAGQTAANPVHTAGSSMNKTNYTLVINGQTLQDRSAYMSQQHLMIPLRSLMESLGYEVKWNQQTKQVEASKGPHWFAVTIGEDHYNFAKMLIKLGQAPELKNGRTYVPASFIEDVLHMNVAVSDTGLVTVKEAVQEADILQETTGVITRITEQKNGTKSLSIMGAAASPNGQNAITVHIDKNTEIVNGLTSKPLTPEEITLNMQVQAFYEDRLTKSLPPQGYAKRLVVTHVLGSVSGTVTEIRTANGHMQLHVDGASDQNMENDVIIGIAPETHIVSAAGEKLSSDTLQKGTKLTAYYGPVMTMSLPPLSTAQTIVIETE